MRDARTLFRCDVTGCKLEAYAPPDEPRPAGWISVTYGEEAERKATAIAMRDVCPRHARALREFWRGVQ